MKNKMNKKLYRSRENKIIAGVCGGIGEHFDIDPIWVRLAFVLFALADGIGIVVYIVAWILIPENPNQKSVKKTKAQEVVARVHSKVKKEKKHNGNGTVLFGTILLFLGGVLLMKNLFSWFKWTYVWPLAIIVFGLYLITRRSK